MGRIRRAQWLLLPVILAYVLMRVVGVIQNGAVVNALGLGLCLVEVVLVVLAAFLTMRSLRR